MPGELAGAGLIAKLVETLVNKFIDEDQIPELMKRRKLAALKKECQDALVRNDWVALADATARLRDLATKP